MKVIIFASFFTFIGLFISGCNKQSDKKDIADFIIISNNPVSPKEQVGLDENLLLGEWSRTDSPGTIKITGVLKNQKLVVKYFNPKSINIGKANWTKTGAYLSVFVELQDEYYLGSFFKLHYEPKRDVLLGEYFKADENCNYQVEFARTK